MSTNTAAKFKKLFEPVNIGKVRINNRIALAPMAILGLVDGQGGLSQRGIDYYVERAIGGTGLLIVGATRITEVEPRAARLFVSEDSITSFGELAELVHHYGSKVFVQLTAGVGRVLPGGQIDQGTVPVSASAVPAYWRPKVMTRALETKEVEAIVAAFGKASRLLKHAGIDGVELHGHEGYLLDQFSAPLWNKRTDKYGGSLENRLRFPVEALNAIKDQAGKDFPVIYRFGLKLYMKGPWSGALKHEEYAEVGRDIEEGLEMARLFEKAGYDALHVDAGCYDSWYWPHPPGYQPYGCMVDMAAKAKKHVSIPVITVGRLDLPKMAEQVLEDGSADIVALGRALLADPKWPQKVRRGRIDDIRPCLGCHDGCMGRMLEDHLPLSCAVNPVTGRERLYNYSVAKERNKVVIIGGGVAGMEAARAARMRGHSVTLYEKGDRLGGHLVAASVPDFKMDLRRLLDWYDSQLKKARVDVRLRTEATPDMVLSHRPDKVIVAIGSTPVVPNVPGISSSSVATCIDLLLGKKMSGKKVAVIGGGLVGCETALWLANNGKEVVVIEALPDVAPGMFPANRLMLLDMLKDSKVRIMTGASLGRVQEGGIEVVCGGNKESIACDTVALAVGLKARNDTFQSLRTGIRELYLVGDCKEPRKIMHAIWDGFHVACGS